MVDFSLLDMALHRMLGWSVWRLTPLRSRESCLAGAVPGVLERIADVPVEVRRTSAESDMYMTCSEVMDSMRLSREAYGSCATDPPYAYMAAELSLRRTAAPRGSEQEHVNMQIVTKRGAFRREVSDETRKDKQVIVSTKIEDSVAETGRIMNLQDGDFVSTMQASPSGQADGGPMERDGSSITVARARQRAGRRVAQ
mmetsp:Transcript_154158/g.493073  ORF Transcript_154158/g.493073 Transcript_154158/m.493073 type:complete len:198 (-) Transcript_154158:2130-2723(-)